MRKKKLYIAYYDTYHTAILPFVVHLAIRSYDGRLVSDMNHTKTICHPRVVNFVLLLVDGTDNYT